MQIKYRTILVESAFWYLVPIVFLYAYVNNFYYPLYSVASHLYVITHLVLLAFFSRVALLNLLGKNLGKWIAAAVYGSFATALWLYYGLVIIGLTAWHKVITKSLITTYTSQLPQLCEAYDFSFMLVLIILFCILLLLIVISSFIIKSTVESEVKAKKTHTSLLILWIALITWRLCCNVFDDVSASDEPITLTLSDNASASKKLTSPAINIAELNAKTHYKASKQATKKNVILIVVDALRPDHMGVYGYHRDTTPQLNAILSNGQGLIAHNVKATCGESACGLTSLASSRFIHDFPDRPFTIHQVLKANGYTTRMILGGDHTNFYNLREKYGSIDSFYDGSMAKDFYMNDDSFLIKKTDELPKWDLKPVIIQYHLMSTHILGLRHKSYNQFLPFRKYDSLTNEPPNIAFTNNYDNGVLQMDAIIGNLLKSLESKGYLGNSLVVITGDHGDGLGEHGKYSHGNSVYDELLNIPLILVSYGASQPIKFSAKNLISQIDIAPSILQELNIEPPSTWSGIPIQSSKKHDLVHFQMNGDFGIYDLRDSQHLWKYWKNIKSNDMFIYDLSADPHEKENLFDRIPNNQKEKFSNSIVTNTSNTIFVLNPQEFKQIKNQ